MKNQRFNIKKLVLVMVPTVVIAAIALLVLFTVPLLFGINDAVGAVKEINWYYAEALGKNRLVPDIQLGSDSGVSNGATDLINMLTVKAAKDLSLDLSVKQ